MSGRIAARFGKLRAEGRKGLVTFITAGDPDEAASRKYLGSLAGSGADFIELGMPFSDPMADGVAIQLSSQRALKSGMTLKKTLGMVAAFREADHDTPLILMGYYNPIYVYDAHDFIRDAAKAGVDGLIVVDLPPEEDAELLEPARRAGIDLIRLVTPTTDAARLGTILNGASGFLYYVSVTGVTGGAKAQAGHVADHLNRIRAMTDLPVAVGFGIRTPDDAREMAGPADAVVVGSALVQTIAESASPLPALEKQVGALAAALRAR